MAEYRHHFAEASAMARKAQQCLDRFLAAHSLGYLHGDELDEASRYVTSSQGHVYASVALGQVQQVEGYEPFPNPHTSQQPPENTGPIQVEDSDEEDCRAEIHIKHRAWTHLAHKVISAR